MTEVFLYSDGACKGNPGIGGWGVILRSGRHEKELFGGEWQTTNNRMELMAVIQGLQSLKRPCRITIYTDSNYVVKGMREWLPVWKANNWRSANKKPVKNQDLWEILDHEANKHDISWHWVKGHAGHPENERADYLANQGVLMLQQKMTNQTEISK